MSENVWLTERFEENRDHLRAVAYRMLGSRTDADDAVQEAWLRLSRADRSGIENLGGWLTTTVARVCLDMLRSRKSRREESIDDAVAQATVHRDDVGHPEQETMLADSVGVAMLVVLESLAPAERVAFVLHDMFDIPFDEIATIVGRSPMATRQLASRARRRVQGTPATPDADLTRRRQVVDAFLAASRSGNFEALLAVLDPDVVVRADAAAILTGATPEIRGAGAVAKSFAGRARAARRALIDGVPGLVWAPGGDPRVVFSFTVVEGVITAIDLVADPDRIRAFEVELDT
jgi:RNA polymerase sigma-70 factor (ECF subfamily)